MKLLHFLPVFFLKTSASTQLIFEIQSPCNPEPALREGQINIYYYCYYYYYYLLLLIVIINYLLLLLFIIIIIIIIIIQSSFDCRK